MDAGPSTRFEIGRVLRRSVSTVRRRWLELLLLTVAFVWGPWPLVYALVHAFHSAWSQGPASFGLRAGLNLVEAFGLAAITAVALRERGGSPTASLGRVLRALPALLPAWVASDYDIAWRFWAYSTGLFQKGRLSADVLADFLLLVAGLELLLAMAVAAGIGVFYPVVLAERRGPLEAMQRAWLLLRGARWKVVSLYLLYLAAYFVITLPSVLTTIARGPSGPVGWITGALADAAQSFWWVAVAASYIELREVKEGAPYDQIAEVFV